VGLPGGIVLVLVVLGFGRARLPDVFRSRSERWVSATSEPWLGLRNRRAAVGERVHTIDRRSAMS
jgi:hypothetical protein